MQGLEREGRKVGSGRERKIERRRVGAGREREREKEGGREKTSSQTRETDILYINT